MDRGADLGPYRIDRQLGSGGMGTVYAAVVEGRVVGIPAGTHVALKVVHPHLLATPGFFKRFLREAEIGRSVAHENVVRTLDADSIGESGAQHHFLVMEYVEGRTLRAFLEEFQRVPEELCRHIGVEVAAGLAAIHAAGVIHRDLKPENVLITPEHAVKVMDLGVARLQDEVIRLSQTGAFVGSVLYAAPEQFSRNTTDIDQSVDLHGLGLLLYELASGAHPFVADDVLGVVQRVTKENPRRLAEINPQLSPFFEEVVHTLLAKQPASRFASADEVLEALRSGEESAWWQERVRTLRITTSRPLRRVRIPRETALYGREEEIERLRALYERAKDGAGQVVLIEGEAGIGKTRLVDEFVGGLLQAGEELNFLFGSYPPGGAATAAGAFSTAYREHFGATDLEETLGRYLIVTQRLIPSFAALLRGEVPPAGETPLTKDSLQTVFVRATRALARERTTIVLVDDLHFAPDEGRALMAAVATAIPQDRVLLIGTMRRGVPKDWVSSLGRLDHGSLMVLPRLGPKDLARLLVDAFHSERLAHELSFRISTKSDGNPFFVFEIIRGLRDGQFITQRDDGSWVTTQIIDEIEIPSSVADLIQGRISGLDEAEREILDLAACCGFEFDAQIVSEALGRARIPTLRSLARIEQTHLLVRAAGRRFVFDHHQVQEALYDVLPPLLREAYHRAIAEVIEAMVATKDPGSVKGDVAVDLCLHYLKGAHGAGALPHLDRALDQLDSAYLNAAAIDLAAQALAVEGLVTGRERFELLFRRARRLGVIGRREEERAALDEALPIADATGDARTRARARVGLASHFGNTGDFDRAEEFSRAAIACAQEAGDGHVEVSALRYLGLVAMYQGRNDESREHLERCLVLCREQGDRAEEATVINGLGALCSYLGRFEEAREHHEESLRIAREVGDLIGTAIATGDLGIVSHELGELAASRAHYQACLVLFEESGDRLGEANALTNLGELHATLGDLPRARDEFEAGGALGREVDFPFMRGYCALWLAYVAMYSGDLAAAEQSFETAIEALRERWPRSRCDAQIGLATLLIGQGRSEEARTHLEEALATARDMGAPSETALAAAQLARLDDGEVTAALATFAEHGPGMRVRERMRARFALWQATRDGVHLTEANRLLLHMREHAPPEYHETMMQNVPVHAEIAAAMGELGA